MSAIDPGAGTMAVISLGLFRYDVVAADAKSCSETGVGDEFGSFSEECDHCRAHV